MELGCEGFAKSYVFRGTKGPQRQTDPGKLNLLFSSVAIRRPRQTKDLNAKQIQAS